MYQIIRERINVESNLGLNEKLITRLFESNSVKGVCTSTDLISKIL